MTVNFSSNPKSDAHSAGTDAPADVSGHRRPELTRRQCSTVSEILGPMASQVHFSRNLLNPRSARSVALFGSLINDTQAAANSPGSSASINSLPLWTSYPSAPSRVDTTGHFRLRASAIFTRVPAPIQMGTIIDDHDATSASG